MIGKTNATVPSEKITEIPAVTVTVNRNSSAEIGISYNCNNVAGFTYKIPICNINSDHSIETNPNTIVIKNYAVGSLTYWNGGRSLNVNTSNIISNLNTYNIGKLFKDQNYILSLGYTYTTNGKTHLFYGGNINIRISGGIISTDSSTVDIYALGNFKSLNILILGISAN